MFYAVSCYFTQIGFCAISTSFMKFKCSWEPRCVVFTKCSFPELCVQCFFTQLSCRLCRKTMVQTAEVRGSHEQRCSRSHSGFTLVPFWFHFGSTLVSLWCVWGKHFLWKQMVVFRLRAFCFVCSSCKSTFKRKQVAELLSSYNW